MIQNRTKLMVFYHPKEEFRGILSDADDYSPPITSADHAANNIQEVPAFTNFLIGIFNYGFSGIVQIIINLLSFAFGSLVNLILSRNINWAI